uniref:Uncharacterized protein n=1 Tax=Vertebrata thuyoides TaxID=2006970 RepID=A0A1Z1MAL8_9FLOR|nr:hypothetical protein [Vertebrata thuyoides]ARW63026.1 hypothetical protein [Vertebrata thuyoides]
MVKYWPTQQSIYLNNSIVDLFIETEKKFASKQYNKSKQYLYLDVLNIINRNRLFNYIIDDFKKLILDLIELNLSLKEINKMNHNIRNIFIERISQKFLSPLRYKNKELRHKIKIRSQYNDLMKYLLIYLIFGSSPIDEKTFVFQTIYTPYNHVKALLENFIIQIGNQIVRRIICTLDNSAHISNFLKSQNLCNKLYSSNRSVVLFLNNLKWQNFLHSYVYEVKCFYDERQQIWILSSTGITTKYIHVSKITEIRKLNQLKSIFIFWLELKDLVIPKIEKLIIQMSKYLLYSLLSLFNSLFLIIIKILVFYLSK